MKFKEFTLDKFQEDAIESVNKGHSVLVSAPTGSGKTLIADYIIDKDIRAGKRIVYTAPIKALSNQKFKDFTEQYGVENIGLITGDLVLNPTAQVLIMTTEVYRNMAIIKDQILGDVSYCIMDEIHFISDEERGYIWEESIMFSPDHIRFLFLSATIPNSEEFAGWVEHIKGHKVEVIKHHIRPVPLDRKFYDIALGITDLQSIKEQKELDSYPQHRQFMKGQYRHQRVAPPDFRELVKELNNMDKLPCIYFVFSRAKTQEYAFELSKAHDFLAGEERKYMSQQVSIEFGKVNKELLSLKSTHELRQCLPRGIAFHNAGMLPDMKHIVEKMFGKGLIKVLFATETFAVGINMPAKTVCFDSLRKHTKVGIRWLTSKEYFQISGRAGRRGIDESGLSVAVIHRPSAEMDKIEEFTSQDVEPLKSQFRLTFNTVLNMVHRHEPAEIDHILRMNLFTYQQLKGRMNDKRVLGSIKARFTKRVKILTKLGYIHEGELTELGIFATKIFADEIEISQIFMGKTELPLDEHSILLIIAGLVYEPKRLTKFFKHNNSKKTADIIRIIRNHPVLRNGTWFMNIENMTAIVEPVYHQKSFVEVLQNTDMPEGDLIRLLTRMVDKLEQIDRALEWNEDLSNRVRTCKHLIKNSLEGIHMF